MDSNLPRQISQSDHEISSNYGKKKLVVTLWHPWVVQEISQLVVPIFFSELTFHMNRRFKTLGKF